jgi:hypothetical protein
MLLSRMAGSPDMTRSRLCTGVVVHLIEPSLPEYGVTSK